MKKVRKFENGDWVSFDRGGPILSHEVIGFLYRVNEDNLEVIFNGESVIIQKDAILERRRRKS